jgi:hypothetical protein
LLRANERGSENVVAAPATSNEEAHREAKMSILDEIARYGEALKKARRYRQTLREINALPPEIQKDIGWPARRAAQGGSHFQSAYWKSLR